MSFVVCVALKDCAYVLGDTQININSKAAVETAIKVFPVNKNVLVGGTGDYVRLLDFLSYVTFNRKEFKNMSFYDVVNYIEEKFRDVEDNSFVVAGITTDGISVKAIGKEGDKNAVTVGDMPFVKVLMPPGIKEEECKKYITSTVNMESQMVNCIKGISKISNTVNDKICGFKISDKGINVLTHNIRYEDITIRIDDLY